MRYSPTGLPVKAPTELRLAPRHLTRRRMFIAIILVSSYLLLEGVCALIYQRVLTYAERRTIAALRLNLHEFTNTVPHPYTLMTLNPKNRDFGFKQINSLGFRSPETTVEKPPGVVRIVCLGGSTTYGYWVEKPEQAYPAQLQEFLRRKTDNTQIEVINAGICYTSSFEVLSTFLYRVLPLEPDLVVVDASLNDVEPLLLPTYSEDYTHWRKNWVLSDSSLGLRSALRSPFVSILYAKLVLPRALPFPYQNTYLDVHNPESIELTPEIRARRPTAYQRNLENLILVARGRGINVQLVNAKNRKPRPHVDWLLELHRGVMNDLSRKYDVPVTDFFRRFNPPPEYWGDINHLTPAGETLKAELVGGDVLANFGAQLTERKSLP